MSWEAAYVTFALIMAALALVTLLVVVEDDASIKVEMERTGRSDFVVLAIGADRCEVVHTGHVIDRDPDHALNERDIGTACLI